MTVHGFYFITALKICVLQLAGLIMRLLAFRVVLPKVLISSQLQEVRVLGLSFSWLQIIYSFATFLKLIIIKPKKARLIRIYDKKNSKHFFDWSYLTLNLQIFALYNNLVKVQMKQKEKSKDKKKQEEEQEEITEEIEQTTFLQIQKLQQCGINAADVAKLKSGGYCTISSIVMATRKDLCNIKGINEAKIEKILEAAKKLENHGFMTGNELAQKRKSVIKITTGSPVLDQLLGGGIETMSITEAFGQFRTGKTQLAHTLCVTTQLPKQKGGGNGKVIYIDTEGTFRPQRIEQIAERFGLDGEEALENIKYARGYTVQHLISLLNYAAALMMESPHSLLIIDSIMAVFRSDFSGRGELAERQQLLGKVLSRLLKLAEQFNIAVFMTNQVMADPGNTMAHVDPKKPIGGHVLAHASTTRLYFRKGKGEQRICKVFDSPCLAENEAVFEISEGGIVDPKD